LRRNVTSPITGKNQPKTENSFRPQLSEGQLHKNTDVVTKKQAKKTTLRKQPRGGGRGGGGGGGGDWGEVLKRLGDARPTDPKKK